MDPILSLLAMNKYIDPIQGYPAWIGLVLLIAALAITAWKTRTLNKPFSKRDWWMFCGFLAALILTNLFLGILLPAGGALPQPQLADDPIRPMIMFFSAVPLVLAGGMLGPAAAAILGMVAGILRAVFLTHNTFTIFQTAFLFLVYGICLRQLYRSQGFRLLRRPLFVLLPVTLLFALLHLLVIPLTISGALVNRIDYALSTLPGFTFARFVELAIAALIGEGVRFALPKSWVSSENLLPSPAEKSLQARFIIYMSPLALVLIITLIAGAWFQAGRTAQKLLQSRLANTAQVAADQIPLLITSGHQLIKLIAEDDRLVSDDVNAVQTALAEDIRILPYFSHLILIDSNGAMAGQYPQDIPLQPKITASEEIGIQLGFMNDPSTHPFTIEPPEGGSTAQIALVTPIRVDGKTIRVLIGRTNLAINPYSESIITSLKELDGDDGASLILDGTRRILVSPDLDQVMTIYQGPVSEEAGFFNNTAPDGTRQFVFYQPVTGQPWSIALIVPASRTQQIAVEIAGPLY